MKFREIMNNFLPLLIFGANVFARFLSLFWNKKFIFSKNSKKSLAIFFGFAHSFGLGGANTKYRTMKKVFRIAYYNPDFIYLFSNFPYLNQKTIASIGSKKKIILNQNGVYFPSWFSGDYELANKKLSIYYNEADFVIWQSDFCRKGTEIFFEKGRIKDKCGEVLYNSVNTEIFIPRQVLRRNKSNRFLIIGDANKNLFYRIDFAIKSLAAFMEEDWTLTIFSRLDSVQLNKFEQLVLSLGVADRVTLFHSYRIENAVSIYQEHDCLLAFKVMDACPNTALEAMSCGLTVIGPSSGGLAELVTGGAGLLFPCEEDFYNFKPPAIQDIESCLEKYFATGNGRINENARQLVLEKFCERQWLEKHDEILSRLL